MREGLCHEIDYESADCVCYKAVETWDADGESKLERAHVAEGAVIKALKPVGRWALVRELEHVIASGDREHHILRRSTYQQALLTTHVFRRLASGRFWTACNSGFCNMLIILQTGIRPVYKCN